jgi:hypothetical protein
MRTLADLKRELTKGKALKLVYTIWNKNNIGKIRYIVKTQTTGFYLNEDKNATKGTYLEFPKSSLLEITDKGFKIFLAGKRDLNEQENEVLSNMPKDEEQSKIDIMTDTNVMYYREKTYLIQKGMLYLKGNHAEKGLRFDSNTKKIIDDSIKGELSLEYEFIGW